MKMFFLAISILLATLVSAKDPVLVEYAEVFILPDEYTTGTYIIPTCGGSLYTMMVKYPLSTYLTLKSSTSATTEYWDETTPSTTVTTTILSTVTAYVQAGYSLIGCNPLSTFALGAHPLPELDTLLIPGIFTTYYIPRQLEDSVVTSTSTSVSTASISFCQGSDSLLTLYTTGSVPGTNTITTCSALTD